MIVFSFYCTYNVTNDLLIIFIVFYKNKSKEKLGR